MKISKKSLIVLIVLCAFRCSGTAFQDGRGFLYMTTSIVPYSKQIPITKNQVAIVPYWWHAYLSQFSWQACFSKKKDVCYAVRSVSGGKIKIPMHREIMRELGTKVQIDHENGNGLLNVHLNLRKCTLTQNNCNRRSHSGSTSRHKGVVFNKNVNRWQAQIQINKKLKYLGLFDNEDLAALAYNEAALIHHGEYARLNQL